MYINNDVKSSLNGLYCLSNTHSQHSHTYEVGVKKVAKDLETSSWNVLR